MRSIGIMEIVNEIPSIVVIGDQSVGKSSVLEQISGIKMPRGSGIVTRCPMQLEMRRQQQKTLIDDEEDDQPSIKIHYRNKLDQDVSRDIESVEKIEDEISQAQQEMLTDGEIISKNTIRVQVSSSYHPDLTVVDLPGIARFPGGSNRVSNNVDMHSLTKDLIRRFIKSPMVLIMAVTPTNTDIETVEALKLAKEVDESLQRTLVVLTQPDLVNPGKEHDIYDLVNHQGPVQIHKGVFMLRCRTQDELNEDVTHADSLANEKAFFLTSKFKELPPENCGTGSLIAHLVEEMFQLIADNIDSLRRRLLDRKCLLEKDLDAMDFKDFHDKYEKRVYLYKLIKGFLEKLNPLLTSSKGNDPMLLLTSSTTGNSRIKDNDDDDDENDRNGQVRNNVCSIKNDFP